MSGERKSVVGTCQAVEQKPGSEWIRFLIEMQGKQYPLRLDTRDEDVIAKAKAVGAGIATWTFNEVESEKINQRSGKPYINRYLEDVVEGGDPANTSGSSSSQGQYTKEDIDRFDEKDRRDFRSRAWAQTLATFEHTVKDDEDPMLVFARLKPFQRVLYEDIVQGLAKEEAPSVLSPADDDIPF